MKKRAPYGTLHSEDGRRVVIKQRSVAQALEHAEQRIETLERVIKQGKEWDERRSREVKERTESLLRLQNHWWTRLGEALRVVTRGQR